MLVYQRVTQFHDPVECLENPCLRPFDFRLSGYRFIPGDSVLARKFQDLVGPSFPLLESTATFSPWHDPTQNILRRRDAPPVSINVMAQVA